MVLFNPTKVLEMIPQILPYLPVTLYVILLSTIIGSLLGLLLAKWRLGRPGLKRRLANSYLYIIRCTPPIVLLFIVFYGLPELLLNSFNLNINSFHRSFFVIITYILLFAAPASETFRAAYLAVDKGQREAALANGLSEFQTFYRIVLPQVVPIALPNFCNSFVNLLKDGTLAYTIGLVDIMGEANLIIGRNYGNYGLETYVAVAIIYWALIIIWELLFAWLEARLTAHQQPTAMKNLKKSKRKFFFKNKGVVG